VLLRFITLSRWDQPAACKDLPTLPRSHRPALSLRTPPQLDYRTGTGRAKDGLFGDPDGPVAVTQRSSARYRHAGLAAQRPGGLGRQGAHLGGLLRRERLPEPPFSPPVPEGKSPAALPAAGRASQTASFTSMICSTAADRAPRVRRDGRVPDAGQLAGHLAAGLPAVIRGSRSRPVLAPLFSATGARPGGHRGRRTGLRSPADDGREATDCYLDVNVNRSAWLCGCCGRQRSVPRIWYPYCRYKTCTLRAAYHRRISGHFRAHRDPSCWPGERTVTSRQGRPHAEDQILPAVVHGQGDRARPGRSAGLAHHRLDYLEAWTPFAVPRSTVTAVPYRQ